jgi:hypothetical protein
VCVLLPQGLLAYVVEAGVDDMTCRDLTLWYAPAAVAVDEAAFAAQVAKQWR